MPDTDATTLAAAVAAAGGDVVLTSGGAGGGPADLVAAALRELGARVVVDGVDCRPGHPQRLAELPDGRWVVALPGNPYAALVAALTLLGPLLAGLTGRPLPELPLAEPQRVRRCGRADPRAAGAPAPGRHGRAARPGPAGQPVGGRARGRLRGGAVRLAGRAGPLLAPPA